MSEQERLISTALAAVAVSKSFSTSARRLVVLNRVSLKIAHGSFTALIGPSGCGKTTLLKILAGIIPFDSGEIVFGGKMGSLGGQVAYMPQSDTLLPWRTRSPMRSSLPRLIIGRAGRRSGRHGICLPVLV